MPKATDGEHGGGAVSVDPRRSAKVGGGCFTCGEASVVSAQTAVYVTFFFVKFLGGVRCERGGATIKGHADEKETVFTEPLRGATPGGEFSWMTTRGFEVC